ncbi:ATP-binding cassette domain-containing protein [Nonomuraea phyllanthi]|uniref:ABC transporter ATP-binding protein n=1 Tax=Nonomuraea phyllanthi TaxID=2219224 RepID=UPI001293A3E3|nr:ABC transporter ATP-binding protein [Nonomuraea phyllanthi]QFY09411.1 ATP-binding cassette domain-containing protein [Nonomuraea phyllanthi]
MTLRDSVRMTRHTLTLGLRADRRVSIAVGVLVLLQAGLAAGIAHAQRHLVDAAGAHLLGGLLAAVALGAIAHALQIVGWRFTHNLRNDLRDRIQMALEQEITESTAKIPTITHLERADFLNRITMLRRGTLALSKTGWAAVNALSALAGIGLSLWLLIGVHPALALLAVAAVPILPLANRATRMRRRAIDATSERLRRESLLHDLCLNPDPAKEVWISGNGAELDRHARALWEEAAGLEARARFRGLGGEIGAWALYFTALAGALLVVGLLLSRGQATLGDAVLVISLAGQLRSQQMGAVESIALVADGGRVAEHHCWLLDYAVEHGVRPATPGLSGPAATIAQQGAAVPARLTSGIELRDVCFAYPGTGTLVLDHVNLTIPAGSSLGLVGINGAGKSTLIKLLTGVHRPTSGTILVDGTDLRELDPSAWAAVCTGTLQDFLKLQTSVTESVGAGDLPRIGDTARIELALRRAGAYGIVEALPEGLRTQLGQTFGGAELSHGQWQRIALARGLMRETPLLRVLDEPTASLDPQAEHDLFELFAEQTLDSARRGAVTILVSHRFSTAHMADHIVVLSHGRVTEQGSHAELLAAGGDYADLYRTQALAYR